MAAPAIHPALLAGTRNILARYQAARDRLPGDAVARDEAAERFATNGLPWIREEAWRYTNLRPVAEHDFAPAAPADDVMALLSRLPEIAAPRLVFANGRFQAAHSVVPSHLRVRTGVPALADLPEDDRLAGLNTMFAEDGAAIEVAEGIAAGTLVLVSLGQAEATRPVGFHPRHAVHLARRASLTLVEIALGDGVYLHNPVMTIAVDEEAQLTHLRLQNESAAAFFLSTLYAQVAGGGSYDSFALALGARLARMEVHGGLNGPRAAAHLNAAQLLGAQRHADFTTVVRHDAPNTTSRQTVKNVLTGRSRAVFQGKIEVARAAQKTDGYQMNQTLLLSPEAEIDSKPQLEIYADDVKCSHGATVGELDAQQIFYLRSRGIPETVARSMLIRAFLTEALEPIAHEEARAALEREIGAWWERQPA